LVQEASVGSTEQDAPVERVDEEPQPVTPERGRLLPGIPRPRLRRGEQGPPNSLAPVLKKVRSYNPKADTKLLERAYRYAEEAHEGQFRLSGEPYVEHPVAVTGILADLKLDTTTLTAALLHDTVEDTAVGLGDIEEGFGNEVARIVDGLTKLDKLEFRSGELAQAENVRKMIVAMAGDIRVPGCRS
jgi:GTP pyrophosphokinase